MNHTLEFAVLGHPNEGKSSLVSTLSEDDSVRISPYPGETTQCRVFPVIIDGREVLRFTDTPGFQAPRRTLDWFEKNGLSGVEKIKAFIEEHRHDPLFKDECELLSPLSRGAFIIFVVDGSRPLRSNDRAEMAILGLTGLPRIAVINNKSDVSGFTDSWKNELNRHFDTVVFFNAHTASYSSRLALLSDLRSIQPADQDLLGTVIDAFKKEWDRRNTLAAGLILDLLQKALTHTVKTKIPSTAGKEREKERIQSQWVSDIKAMEKTVHQNIRALFKHNIFNVDLPDQSLAAMDLFDKETWKVLGLSRTELAASAGTLGAAAAAGFDLALAGHSLGLFAVIGGLVGAGSALLGAKRIGKARVLGKHLGNYTLKAGPNRNLQFMMVLIDRALIYYSHIINWAHGRRMTEQEKRGPASSRHPGVVSKLAPTVTRVFIAFFSETDAGNSAKAGQTRQRAAAALKAILKDLSEKENEFKGF